MRRKRLLIVSGILAAMFFGAQSDFSYTDGLMSLACLSVPVYCMLLQAKPDKKA